MRSLAFAVPLLIVGFVVLAPGTDAKIPVPSCVLVPCVGVAPPTYVGSDAECHVFLNFAGSALSCAVDGGKASVADAACELCVGVTILDCDVGTQVNDCFQVAA